MAVQLPGDRTEQLLAQALALSHEERAALAAALIESLGRPPGWGEDDPGFAAELARRAERSDAGEGVARDWADVERDVRAALRRR
jgi:hypothetical protein